MPTDLKPLHVLNRLGFGPRPGDIQRVTSLGIERYLREQLFPDQIPLPESLHVELHALDTLPLSPILLFRDYGPPAGSRKLNPDAAKAARTRSRIVIEQATQARLLRALESPRQLQEVMVDFWFNHFNVFAGKGLDRLWVGAYEEEAIRPYVLGHFRQLLGATAKHPAMLFYLDNWLNTAPGSSGAHGKFAGLNENYARELMELHTLGVDGGYTQQDVIALARIFTGWGLCIQGGGRGQCRRDSGTGTQGNAFFFDARRHDFDTKIFLGHTIEGTGITEGEKALDLLARSPTTARHVSAELAQYFVADHPPESLIRSLAERFLEADGDMRAVLDALFHSSEFWDQQNYASKFKTSYQYIVSAIRATGIRVSNFRPLVGTLQQLGMPLYGCLTPDGYKNTQDAWLNPDAMTRRLTFATALASGRLPLSEQLPTDQTEKRGLIEVTHEPPPVLSHVEPPYPFALTDALGKHLSSQTVAAVRAALLLGSPEFMKR